MRTPLTHKSPAGSKPATYIGSMILEPSKQAIGLDESATLMLSLKVLGGLRDRFGEGGWKAEYDAGGRGLRVNYRLGLGKVKAHLLRTGFTKPQKLVRRATFYWSRDPDFTGGKIGYQTKVWALIMMEDGRPVVPKSIDEARALMFDLSKGFEVLGADLGRGDHRLFAKVKVKWGRRNFIEPGSVEKTSNVVRLSCR